MPDKRRSRPGEDLVAELEKLRSYAHELELLTEERSLRLDQKQRELQQFLFAVSHDLKAPILSIQGFCGLLAQEFGAEIPEEARRYLARIDSNASWMKRLIDDLLELSRVGRLTAPKGRIDMMALARDVVLGLSFEIERSGARVVISPESVVVMGERRALEQVWSNLIENALRYRSESRPLEIRISWAREERELVFSVEDNGAGMPANLLGRVFVPFQRAAGAADRSGTGIGLAIVRRIVEALGGRVGVDSRLGEGSRFFFALPESAAARDEPAK